MTLYIGPHMNMSDFNNNILNICRSVKSMGGNCLQIFLGDNQKLELKYKYKISDKIISETNFRKEGNTYHRWIDAYPFF